VIGDDILPEFDPWWTRFQIVHKVPREIADKLEEELRSFMFDLYEAEREIIEDGQSYEGGYEDAVQAFERRAAMRELLCDPDQHTVLRWLAEMKEEVHSG
jgi:hypothetical protein